MAKAHPINPAARLARFDECWSPRTASVEPGPGDVFAVPTGSEHKPVALESSGLMVVKPSGSPDTGEPELAAVRIER